MRNLLLLFTVIAFIGCKEEPKEEVIINEYDVTMVDDIAYLKHDMSLVTGKIKGLNTYEGTFKDGKKNGVFMEWWPSGQLFRKGTWKDGKKDGVHKGWFDNGQLWQEVNYKDGKNNGFYKSWYEDGQLERDGNWKDGKKDGVHIGMYEDDDGKLFHKWTYENGKLISEKHY